MLLLPIQLQPKGLTRKEVMQTVKKKEYDEIMLAYAFDHLMYDENVALHF
jgi:hypothetical protein